MAQSEQLPNLLFESDYIVALLSIIFHAIQGLEKMLNIYIAR